MLLRSVANQFASSPHPEEDSHVPTHPVSAAVGRGPRRGAGPRTEDAKIPDGFTTLFNGKDLTGWKVNKGGKMEVWAPKTACCSSRAAAAAGS